jgi:exopolysaccharide biosynthesis polyprenyl glycosylphosphotransferase
MLVARRTLLRQGLAFSDAAALLVSFAAAYWLAAEVFGRYLDSFAKYTWLIFLIVPIWLGCLWIFGLYTSAAYQSVSTVLNSLLRTQFLAGLLLLSLMYITRSEAISRVLIQTFLVVSFAVLNFQKLALKVIIEHGRRWPERGQRKIVLLASPPDFAARYLDIARVHSSLQADVVGVVTTELTQRDFVAAKASAIIGVIDDLPVLLQTRVIDEVVVVSTLSQLELERVSRWCSNRGILMRILIEVPPPVLGVWNADHLDDGAFLLSLSTIPQNAHQMFVKRIVDVMGGVIGLLVCAIAYAWYGPRLRHETGDSIVFRQQRVGQNHRHFTLYKFRTMRAGSEQIKSALGAQNEMTGPIFKLRNDPRVTPTGRKLRRRHLDELPQFWNVLKGEMSLVGTRPPTGDETAVYLEHHQRRLSMRPGLTGLWQLNGNGTVKDFEEVVKLDCEYIDNWSLWLDFKIVAKTVTKVMRGEAW